MHQRHAVATGREESAWDVRVERAEPTVDIRAVAMRCPPREGRRDRKCDELSTVERPAYVVEAEHVGVRCERVYRTMHTASEYRARASVHRSAWKRRVMHGVISTARVRIYMCDSVITLSGRM